MKKLFRKTLMLLSVLFTLTACGGTDETQATASLAGHWNVTITNPDQPQTGTQFTTDLREVENGDVQGLAVFPDLNTKAATCTGFTQPFGTTDVKFSLECWPGETTDGQFYGPFVITGALKPDGFHGNAFGSGFDSWTAVGTR